MLQAPEIHSGGFKAQILTPAAVLDFYFRLREEPKAPEPFKRKMTKTRRITETRSRFSASKPTLQVSALNLNGEL